MSRELPRAARLEARLSAARLLVRATPLPASGGDPAAPHLGPPASFLLSRERPAIDPAAPATGDTLRAECGLLTLAGGAGGLPEGSRVLERRPPLDPGAPVTGRSWILAPPGLSDAQALRLPVVADILDLLQRAGIASDGRVSSWCAGLPPSLLEACIRSAGGEPVPIDLDGAREAGGEARSPAAFLYRPDTARIAACLRRMADRGSVMLFDPWGSPARFDFYPDVHRRGLRVAHGAPGCGGLSEEAMARSGRVDLSPDPPAFTVSLAQALANGTALDLPDRWDVMILRLDP